MKQFFFFFFIEGVKAKVFIRAKPFLVQDRRYLRLQQLKMDFSVQNIKMGVENVRDSNAIICKYLFKSINNSCCMKKKFLRGIKNSKKKNLMRKNKLRKIFINNNLNNKFFSRIIFLFNNFSGSIESFH